MHRAGASSGIPLPHFGDSRVMDARVQAEIGAGGGLVTAQRLRDMGVDPRWVARAVRQGDLVAVRRGVYTTAEVWQGLDEFRGRPLARVSAAHLTISLDHVFSHDSAAVIHDLPLIDARTSDVHVTRGHCRGSRLRHGVRHHGARYSGDSVLDIEGLPVLPVERTVADLAREHGYEHGLVAADAAMRRGVSREALGAAYADMRCWPGVSQCRAVVDDADPGAESAAETLARVLIKQLGIGPVETQFPVVINGRVLWADLRVGCHLFEIDGFIKLRPVGKGGVATRTAEQVVWADRKRDRELSGVGLGISHLVWTDVWGGLRGRALIRLAAEAAVTHARFGPTLPSHLEETAARLRGQRNPAVTRC